MSEIHETLSQMMTAGKFEPYLRYIRFPYFRNIRESTQIEFNHPVTVLVGPNGSNKTAILRALQGCPDYYNVGNYWFSTSLDPIVSEARHRFIHGYYSKSADSVVEVIKTRIDKPDNPDYFEPSRPIERDGMARMPPLADGEEIPADRTKTRWKAIQKPVVYLDFRSELSAYDKYFFHAPPQGKNSTSTSRKNFIRRRSLYLVDALETKREKHKWYGQERIATPAHMATSEQVDVVSYILGRSYESIQIIAHRYFNVDGLTVVLRSSGMRYSEAFAGSGEFAVAVLVTTIMSAKDGSLILLDEPEVSLHPGAQRNLMNFLADQAKRRKFQFVVSTHSPEMIRDLPPNAIKVLHTSDVDGKVDLVSQESQPSEAFFRLGVPISRSKTVYVEDRLAAAIVKYAMQPLGQAVNMQVEVMPIPGGAAGISTKFVPAFALTKNENALVFLDGDQKPEGGVPASSSVPDSDLMETVKRVAGGNVKISPDGSKSLSNTDQKNKQLRLVLDWFSVNVDYLPGMVPEGLLCEMLGISHEYAHDKIYWERQTRSALNRPEWASLSSDEIFVEQERALAKVDFDHPSLVRIRTRVAKFVQRGRADA